MSQSHLDIKVGFKLFKYLLWHRCNFKNQVKKAKQHPNYIKLAETLKEFELEKPILKKQSLSSCTFTVFDLETTGFFPEIGDEIISIGAIKIHNQQVLEKETFYQVINPLQNVSKETEIFTGLNKKDFQHAVTLPVGLEGFLEFSKGTILVAHPATFDINFLQKRIKKWDLPSFNPVYIDSFALSNFLLDTQDSYLDKMVETYNIVMRERHHALNDAIMTAEVFVRLLEECMHQQLFTVEMIDGIMEEKVISA